MSMRGVIGVLLVLLLVSLMARAAELVSRAWEVDGVKREALVHVPPTANTTAAPLVFVWHGHGGTALHAARSMPIHERWPEAIAVYGQGLKTPGKRTDPEGKKSGWQSQPGDQSDRDLKFFDAMLASMRKELKVDDARIYSTGHSNGGGFTYLLWGTRGDIFAAIAPSAALITGEGAKLLKPKPMLHIAGENDPLVKFTWQQFMINNVIRLDGAATEAKPWPIDDRCKIHPAPSGNDVVTYIHAGTHTYPTEAPELIVKFFKQYARPAK
jgi:polyhydroxybutyrate depolymerase